MSYYGMDDPQAAANGMGAYFEEQAPVLPNLAGLGEDYYVVEDSGSGAAAAGAVSVLWLLGRAVGGYVAGRAMAPTAADRNTWGVVGSLLGTIGGPLALGVVGVLALKSKGT